MENEIAAKAGEPEVFSPVAIIKEQTEPICSLFKNYFTLPFLTKAIGTFFVLLILYIVYRIFRSMIRKIPEKSLKPAYSLLFQKILLYVYYGFSCVYILGLFGIKLSVIWGAAGIAGVALGFASQTSVSNIISGIFVLSERTMQVGDLVTIDDITGIVDSTDLLSVKIRTLDNQLVRIPNSTIINNNLINTSFYPNRRMTVKVSVSYETDLQKALAVLKKIPDSCPTVLDDPAPGAWIDSFGESGINMVLAVWFRQDSFLQTKNDVFVAVQKVFAESGITIPFNHLDVSILPERNVTTS